jgi:hypothetical protein
MSSLIFFAVFLLFWGAVLAAGTMLYRRGKLTTVALLPYQRGVLYKQGLPVRDVGPGKHRVWFFTALTPPCRHATSARSFIPPATTRRCLQPHCCDARGAICIFVPPAC